MIKVDQDKLWKIVMKDIKKELDVQFHTPSVEGVKPLQSQEVQ